MKFHDIKEFPNIHYHVDIPIEYLKSTIDRYVNEHHLDMNPDFQRGYVWTEEQKTSYIEFLLKNPTSGLEIYFNHPDWMGHFKGDFVLVDGKQRLEAVLSFFDNKVKAYGYYYKEYEDRPRFISLSFNVGKLQTRKEVLQWYLAFNTGGTYHTKDEVDRVKELLSKEK